MPETQVANVRRLKKIYFPGGTSGYFVHVNPQRPALKGGREQQSSASYRKGYQFCLLALIKGASGRPQQKKEQSFPEIFPAQYQLLAWNQARGSR
ncbi:hypothetical protein DXT99_15840 [Pontibacter diazotrophicus]|uniref:Uncharacterized protein n=1 Tax=Pontibacter diazotrophicus TaxID=1400979 RepID=A0A3D8L9G3_9BACT|nr:hypothetical protein DXT99_15840 [Pontibacter diazotrophicus]